MMRIKLRLQTDCIIKSKKKSKRRNQKEENITLINYIRLFKKERLLNRQNVVIMDKIR